MTTIPTNAERERFMAALRQTETGSFNGYYTAIHPRGAVGAYQMSTQNFNKWSAEYGLDGADWRDPAVQDYIVRRRVDELYSRYQEWDLVAVAWFAGEPIADYAAKTGGAASVGPIADAEGVTVGDYIKTIRANMERAPKQFEKGRLGVTGRPEAPSTPGSTTPERVERPMPKYAAAEASPMRPKLSRALSVASNRVAGGQRSALPPATPSPYTPNVAVSEPVEPGVDDA